MSTSKAFADKAFAALVISQIEARENDAEWHSFLDSLPPAFGIQDN